MPYSHGGHQLLVPMSEIGSGAPTPPENFFYVPQFTHPDVSSVTFGGFHVGRYIASQPNAFNGAGGDNPDVADGADPGSVKATTQYGVPAWRYIDLLDARKAAANNGPGYHLMTAFEYASVALWSQMNGTMPAGNNANTNPPSSVDDAGTATLDEAANARSAGWYPNAVGTGPNSWNHNNAAGGISDLNGNMWEWANGLLHDAPTGNPYVLASLDVTLAGSPYGSSTSVAAGQLTDSNKGWTADEFLDAGGDIYVYDAAGTLHQLATSTPANDGDTLFLANTGTTPAAGPYTVVKYIATDITAGMSSGNRILTLRNSDADLKPFAIPATTDGTGSATYGNDGYWFATTSLRAAIRAGGWNKGVHAGAFALGLNNVPGHTYVSIGLRVAKSI